MSNYTTSIITIAPLSRVDDIHAISIASGHSDRELSLSLSADSISETHRGCHAWALPEVADAWLYAPAIPPFDAEETEAIRGDIILSVATGIEPAQHWATVLAEHGLSENYGAEEELML